MSNAASIVAASRVPPCITSGSTTLPEQKFFLIDTYCGIPEETLVDDPNRELLSTRYDRTYDDVVRAFAPFPNAVIVQGKIPDILPAVDCEKICYLSIDLNTVGPSVAAAEHFWDRMVSGAPIVLDDYGQTFFAGMKEAYRRLRPPPRSGDIVASDQPGTVVQAMITVLGATGFIGSHLVRHLDSSGAAWQAPARGESLRGRSLGNVIDCAGITGDFRVRPYDTVDAHVGRVVDIARHCSLNSFVYLSSTRLYKDHPNSPAREDDDLKASPVGVGGLYNLSKAMGEAVTPDARRPRLRRASVQRLWPRFGGT